MGIRRKRSSPAVSFNIFMDNYFTSFRLLTHLRVNNIRATRVLNKIGYANTLSLATSSYKKQERGHFEQRSAHQAKKQCNLCGWAIYIASSEFCQPNIDLFGVGIKSKESAFKNNNNQIFHLFEIFHQMLVMMTQNIIRCNLNAGVFRTPSSIYDGVVLRKQLTT